MNGAWASARTTGAAGRWGGRTLRVWPLASLLVLLVETPPGEAGGATAPSAEPAAHASAVPVAEVATRAAEVPSLLRTLTEPLAPSPGIDGIRKRLPGLRQDMDADLADVPAILQDRPTLDLLQVGDLSGEVSWIGIRASTVRTWQGAEISVPNAQLVTDHVTNWTLSDRRRRIDLHVGVDYGSPPEKVVEVLEAVARAHPQVLDTPAPQAVFKAFGDSSINFELRAWTARFERWPVTQTELAAAVPAALHAAGMSLPFPQREVRLLRDEPAQRENPPDGPRARATGTELR